MDHDPAKAFNSWRQTACGKTAQWRIVRGALSRWNSRHLSMAWVKWCSEASLMNQELHSVKHAVMHMASSKVATAFETWHSTAAELRDQAARLATAETWVKKAQQKEMQRSWRSWVVMTAEMRHQKHMMRRAINKWLQRRLTMAFNKWQCEALQRKSQRQSVMHLLASALGAALATWREAASTALSWRAGMRALLKRMRERERA